MVTIMILYTGIFRNCRNKIHLIQILWKVSPHFYPTMVLEFSNECKFIVNNGQAIVKYCIKKTWQYWLYMCYRKKFNWFLPKQTVTFIYKARSLQSKEHIRKIEIVPLERVVMD